MIRHTIKTEHRMEMDEAIDFIYEDTDSYQNEISELYSYSEESEFFANRNAFEESMEDCGLPLTWKHMVPEQQSRAINYLMTTLEVSCRSTRMKSCRALAYLVQGNFGECLTLEEQASNSRENVFLLYDQGLFQAFVQQLLIEEVANLNDSSEQADTSNNPSAQTFNDSSEMRLILSVLCTITETMYQAKDSTEPKIQEMRQQFVCELQNPIGDQLLSVTLFQMLNNFCAGMAPSYPVRKITLLLWKVVLITLGGTQTLKDLKEESRMMSKLEPLADETLEVTKSMRPCSPPVLPDGQTRPKASIHGCLVSKRKTVLKQSAFDDAVFAYAKECLLNSLAELNMENENENENDNENENENENNNENEDENGNENENENEHENETENENGNKSENEGVFVFSHSEMRNCSRIRGEKLNDMRQTAVDNNVDFDDLERNIPDAESAVSTGSNNSSETNSLDSGISADNEWLNQPSKDIAHKSLWTEDEDQDEKDISSVQPTTSLKPANNNSQLDGNRSDVTNVYKGLPWTPKVRKADLNQHLSNIRQKFLGYTLPNDLETTFGLPDPIVEGVNVLKKHLYVSLSDVQLEREEAIEKWPLTHKEANPNYEELPAEKLYKALLPRLPQYVIALLKILLAASTSSKNKSERAETLNIMCELSSENGSASIIQTMKMNADANRHKEIIIKAVSATLILLLKHFKVNHIYQFEYVSQQLMFANCIPLILKFLSQDIYSYIVSSKSTISAIDFPACVIGEQPELTTEAIELCSFQPYSWRNMFSCINLVRVLNKLTKWKHSRIMMLVVFKSAPTLTKALSVRHSMFQLYVLKLLKVQLKFLGRQWKKSNMKLISAIYQKVRHRLTDDWAYSNDHEARPWDFQAEEFTLQANINKFHQRRYQSLLAPIGRGHSQSIFNQSDKFGGFDDCTDEDYDFGMNEVCQISPHFERNYERWLESEVFQRNIDWDKLLSD